MTTNLLGTTIIVQVGNSDDKLPQTEWVNLCWDVRHLLENYVDLHFVGFSHPDAPWQNACFVGQHSHECPPNECTCDRNLDELRRELSVLAEEYGQDSIALTLGETEFVKP